jgi:hypothetical protein
MQPPPLSPGGRPSESTGIEGSDAVSGSEKVVKRLKKESIGLLRGSG